MGMASQPSAVSAVLSDLALLKQQAGVAERHLAAQSRLLMSAAAAPRVAPLVRFRPGLPVVAALALVFLALI